MVVFDLLNSVLPSIFISFTATLLLCFLWSSHAETSVLPDHPLTDGNTIISPGGVYELGFFTPGRSANRYVGIWYHHFTSIVVWVANRESPIPDSSGSLSIAPDGNLVLLDSRQLILWSSNVSLSSNNSTAALLDTGNFVLNNSGDTAWQSFDHPTDTYLPGMKVGLDFRNNVNHLFTSWRSADDPSPGNFTMGMNPDLSTQIFLWKDGEPRWRSGRWNGQLFIGVEGMIPEYMYGFRLSNFQVEQQMYFYYNSFNSTLYYVLSTDGLEKQLVWQSETQTWREIWAEPATECEVYNRCGSNASCRDGADRSPVCSCLKGFVPTSTGCQRRTALSCEKNGSGEDSSGKTDGFFLMQGVKLPDLSDWDSDSTNQSKCEESCLMNCSCKAYSFVPGIGCLIWGRDLVDIHEFSNGGNDFYLRLAASEFMDKKVKIPVFLILAIGIPILFALGCIWFLWKFRRKIIGKRCFTPEPSVDHRNSSVGTETGLSGMLVMEGGNNGKRGSKMFSFDAVAAATENFSESNFLGAGGFGPVYKGELPGGQEIAVKRLSQTSGQGIEQFKNEVTLITKLQHRNLVRLLGFCTHREDKMLIYEYMRNKSLDAFLFDKTKRRLLDWKTRYNIIEGIARGLLYLHRDSRLRVIHRDLKASNILLDDSMNPKISDFGMARILGCDGNESTTKRVVGTYGYMSPEYAMQGLLSVKSDIYSFGILILEIISGERNSTYWHPHLYLNLIAYAWKLWKEGNVMEFVDPLIRDSCEVSGVSKCVNLGLSCVQDRACDRPNVASVIVMLEGGTMAQSTPKQPTFAFEQSTSDESTHQGFVSGKSLVITTLSGR
ncbi:hypothetical protein HPP92_009199 [Vanilla planifolia]|uniref:Receptor-like serine/threonine-protein kinase n=1 Tax=Vanilla planifolia TaxID=51239 RepID=A0A835V4H4_VANPL|nr:hypothetical protein HPP92_009199 [Vanilla planifolia]